ncbi:3-phosphoserine/phosphohydroxythreonine transaminase [Bacillus sp. FJAT-44742]|uniref:3-phosphoserine/phosphohydroxythreonine transaminase n=1 Tax=Bacillus sp. FJAT-44742 TaxID=2014005 RepID=UPI000C24164D|nr:3-phosphoserine/phosphohydroxythreonine transaminase [Bacillus sp. FJAT-44742]
MNRAHNFNAGPAALPAEVLEKAKEELLNFEETGMSVMELSHRSKEYDNVHNKAISLLKELLNVPEDYEVILLQGGASLQFSMIPMNFLKSGETANYILTGSWSEKALKEAKILGETKTGASSKETNYDRIPELSEIDIDPKDSYVHLTTNNTIFGTQWPSFEFDWDTPVMADMSSDILCRPIPLEKFSLIYAGAQKNLGPSGVTVVILKKSLLEKIPDDIPTLLKYDTHTKSNSLYHTPPTFGIYMLKNVLEWIQEHGGLEGMEKRNKEKADILYKAIDESDGFYKGHADKDSRSLMNVTFNLPNDELNKLFLKQAKERNMIGLNGHRSVGGCRASIYNAVSLESCKALRDFMLEFQQQHG